MKTFYLSLSMICLTVIAFTGCRKNTEEKPDQGAVYVMDNSPNGNHVIAFTRETDGSLSPDGVYPTGGMGTGSGLGSQGSVIMDDKYLYACNAGSDEITIFAITSQGLTWIDKISSYGSMPVSLTVHGKVLYALNAGKNSNISGFRVGGDGHLTHMLLSDRPLSDPAAGGAQIAFNASGSHLVVTEKATNKVNVFPVYSSGLAGAGVAHPSSGKTPFGFAFASPDVFVVTEAFEGAAGAGAVSSYNLANNGNLSVITGSAATHQTSACWAVATIDGRYCYAANTGSASVSGYRISSSGALSLVDASGVSGVTGATPGDLALSWNSQYLYTRNSGANSITIFKVNNNGSLTSSGSVPGLPAGCVGIAAR